MPMITVLSLISSPTKMIEIENEHPMHLTLVSRGDTKRAKELLAEQDEILEQIVLDEEMEEDEPPEPETEAP